VLSGEIRRLMIFQPPQTGKSELVSRRFPACALGRNPDIRILSASYSASLATDMSRDVQRIIDSDTYRQLFPGTRLAGSRDAEQRTVEQFDAQSGASAGASQTLVQSMSVIPADWKIFEPVAEPQRSDSVLVRDSKP